jgi:hypothetical protein
MKSTQCAGDIIIAGASSNGNSKETRHGALQRKPRGVRGGLHPLGVGRTACSSTTQQRSSSLKSHSSSPPTGTPVPPRVRCGRGPPSRPRAQRPGCILHRRREEARYCSTPLAVDSKTRRCRSNSSKICSSIKPGV